MIIGELRHMLTISDPRITQSYTLQFEGGNKKEKKKKKKWNIDQIVSMRSCIPKSVITI